MQTSLTYNLPAVSLNEPILIMSACFDISLCTTTRARHVVQHSHLITPLVSCFKFYTLTARKVGA